MTTVRERPQVKGKRVKHAPRPLMTEYVELPSLERGSLALKQPLSIGEGKGGGIAKSETRRTISSRGRRIDPLQSIILMLFPWARNLPAKDRRQFAAEAATQLRASVAARSFRQFQQTIDDWKNTADIWSDATLARALNEDVDAPIGIAV